MNFPCFGKSEMTISFLSTCNGRFMDLDNAFQNVVEEKSPSLFVYSDMGGSNVEKLLREIFSTRRKRYKIG